MVTHLRFRLLESKEVDEKPAELVSSFDFGAVCCTVEVGGDGAFPSNCGFAAGVRISIDDDNA